MEKQFTQFDGGFSKGTRDTSLTTCSYVKHFDVTRDKNKMIPQFSVDNTYSGGNDSGIKRVVQAGDNYFALKNVLGVPQIWKRTGHDQAWALATNGDGFTEEFVTDMFIYYQPTNKIYFYGEGTANGVTYISTFDVATNTADNLGTSIGVEDSRSGGFIRPDDGKLYFGTENKLHQVNQAGTIAQDILTNPLPTQYQITSVDSHGVYLSVACQDQTLEQKSTVYIVDMDLTDPAPVDVVDFGVGQIKVCGSVGGVLVGISDLASSTDFLDEKRIAIRTWSGGDEAKDFREVYGTLASGALTTQKETRVNALYFIANLTDELRSGGDMNGIWAVKINAGNELVLVLDTVETIPDPGVVDPIDGFAVLGSFRYIMSASVAGDVSITDGDGGYATEEGLGSIWVSNKIKADRLGRELDLKFAALRTEPLPTGATAILAYRKDEDTAWTKIISEATDDNVLSSSDTDNAGAEFEEGYEYQFKIESLGGAVVTGLYLNFDEENDG